MANECMNYITIKGEPELLQIFADSYLKKLSDKEYGLDFNIIAPIPKDCENDYDYRIHNWGNKWDGTHGNVEFWADDEIFIDVSTAWGPCDCITTRLISLCPGLYFYHEYYEGGCGFVGTIEHHPDEGPDEYELIDFSCNDDEKLNYWRMVFDKEFETIDWLLEVIEDVYADEEISKQDYEELREVIDSDNFDEALLVEMALEKGVL